MRTADERFDAFVYPDPNTGCHLWGGCDRGKGYGAFYDGNAMVLAHRYAYERITRAYPEGPATRPSVPQSDVRKPGPFGSGD